MKLSEQIRHETKDAGKPNHGRAWAVYCGRIADNVARLEEEVTEAKMTTIRHAALILQLEADYYELIMAIGNKYEDETRHETALRYIMERENQEGRCATEEQEDA